MAGSQFHLEIISPDGIIYKEDIDEVSLPTTQGQITVLPHHIPLYAKLEEGEAHIKKSGKTQIIAILGGMVEVGSQAVSIITDYAIRAESIELAKAQEAKKRAEDVIKNKEETVDYTLANDELRKSILELNVGMKFKKKTPQI